MFVVISRAAALFGTRVLPHPPTGGFKQLSIRNSEPAGQADSPLVANRDGFLPTDFSATVIRLIFIIKIIVPKRLRTVNPQKRRKLKKNATLPVPKLNGNGPIGATPATRLPCPGFLASRQPG
jgi:hypothetical protein